MRLFWIVILALSLSSCANPPFINYNYYDNFARCWQGHSVELLRDRLGPPQRIVREPNGNVFYVYKPYACRHYIGRDPCFPYRNCVIEVYPVHATTWFKINHQGVILQVIVDGDDAFGDIGFMMRLGWA